MGEDRIEHTKNICNSNFRSLEVETGKPTALLAEWKNRT